MPPNMNTITTDLVGRELVRLRLRQWGTIWIVSMIITAGISAWLAAPTDRSAAAGKAAARREQARLDTLRKRLETAQLKLEDLREQEGLVLELGNQPPHLLALWSVSAAAARNEGPVRVESFVLQRQDAGRMSTRGNTRDPARTKRIVMLEGTAADSQSVASFAASLRDSGAFSEVELESTKVDTSGAKERVHYVLNCMF